MGDNRGPELAGVLITLLVLSIVAVGLRTYSMGILVKRFLVEDWLALVTLAIYIVFTVFGLLGVHYGLGAHVEDVPLEKHSKALLWRYVAQNAYIVISALTKFIVGLFLLRVCERQSWRTWIIWTMLGVSGLANLIYFFIAVFQCQPIEFYWFRYDPNPPVRGKCNNTALATIPSYIVIFVNVVVDWGLAILPVSVVWNAQMERKLKISVSLVLGLGSIASLATIVRIPYAKQLLSNPDYLYSFTDLAIWSTVEIGLALTASSLATLKPLFRKLKFLATSVGSSRKNTSGMWTERSGTGTGMSASRTRGRKSEHLSITASTGFREIPSREQSREDGVRLEHPNRAYMKHASTPTFLEMSPISEGYLEKMECDARSEGARTPQWGARIDPLGAHPPRRQTVGDIPQSTGSHEERERERTSGDIKHHPQSPDEIV